MLERTEHSIDRPSPMEVTAGKMLVDVRQAATALDCGRTLVYQLIADGELGTVKVGRLTRIPVTELEAFVARRLGQSRLPHG